VSIRLLLLPIFTLVFFYGKAFATPIALEDMLENTNGIVLDGMFVEAEVPNSPLFDYVSGLLMDEGDCHNCGRVVIYDAFPPSANLEKRDYIPWPNYGLVK